MPVPWKIDSVPFPKDGTNPYCKIDRVSDRAITLTQLLKLRDYLKRLCKAGILHYDEKDPFRPKNAKDSRIFWFNLNQYHINELVLKRIIPEDNSCSWVELIADGPQPPDTFVSHAWAESFRDFVCSIEHHALEQRVRPDHAYWFCVYADNQWMIHQELKTKLKESPFYTALSEAKETLIMLDREGVVIDRAWCLWEWHQSMVKRPNTLRVATVMGLVGSSQVSSGPYIELLESVKSSKAQASDPSDLRRIQNDVAGCEETQGLDNIVKVKFAADGVIETEGHHGFKDGDTVIYKQGVGESLVLGRKPMKEGQQFLVKIVSSTKLELRLNSSLVRAQNGRQANLIKTSDSEDTRRSEWLQENKVAFDALDKRIRTETLTETRPSFQYTRSPGNLNDPVFRAITLAQLRNFVQEARRQCLEEKWDRRWSGEGTIVWNDVTWYDIKHFVVMGNTRKYKCSFKETISKTQLRGHYYFTFPWDTNVQEFMNGIEWLAEARQLPDTTPLLICPLSLNFWKDNYYADELYDRLSEGCECAVFAGKMKVAPLLNFQLSIAGKKPIDIICGTGVLSLVQPFPVGSWEFGRFDIRFAAELVDLDLETSVAHNDDLRDRLLNMSADARNSLKNKVRTAGAGPVLRDAAHRNETTTIKKVFDQCEALNPQSSYLQGPLGETPLHVTAAAGSVDTMKFLLDKGADINAADFDGETPLHLAALAGQAASVWLLLSKNADTTIESYFSETALELAMQRPACFIVDNYDAVLEEFERRKRKTAEL